MTICNGSSITLTASGGATDLWTTGQTSASISVSPNETTTYTVTAYNSAGDNSDTDQVVVTVNALPNVNVGADRTINSGETIELVAFGADSYVWSNGTNGPSLIVSPTETTTYSVTGTTNGCEGTDSVTVVVESPEPESVTAYAG